MPTAPKKGSTEIGQRLRDTRKGLDWTQDIAAEKLGITPTHYKAIENGRKDFSKDLLIRMAIVFNVGVDYLLFGKADTGTINNILSAVNTLPDHKRTYAWRIIRDLIEALKLE